MKPDNETAIQEVYIVKRFNVTGTCIPQKHYMVDTSAKLEQITKMIEQDSYFTINRARQYGKTTSLMLLWRALKERYIVVSISFEGMGAEVFQSEDTFIRRFCGRVSDSLKLTGYDSDLRSFWECRDAKEDMDSLKMRIRTFCTEVDREVLLFIDEVDKSSDNQLFLNFLGVLREMYLERAYGAVTFKSVILAGVYDIKNLKLKLRPDDERKYNSPWNVAVDFMVDMSFSAKEIGTMLKAYEEDHMYGMDIEAVSEEIYRYTAGYPFLVSLICLWIDERLPDEGQKKWDVSGVRQAVREILKNSNTLFDDVIKNIENNKSFGEFIEQILLEGNQIPFKVSNPEINLGITFGIISEKNGLCQISTIIFETYIYDHFVAERLMEQSVLQTPRRQFLTADGKLDMNHILKKFQELMKAEYRSNDDDFLEKQGRLLFLCFLKPIINGTGHYVVEPQTRDNSRMDIVVFYGSEEYIIELKKWYGEKKDAEGIKQLAGYLESRSQKKGWMISFCFNKNKEQLRDQYTRESLRYEGKEISTFVV